MINRLRRTLLLQLLPLAGGFVVLAGIVGGRAWLIEEQASINEQVRAAFIFERHVVSAMSLVQDAETGQRGYLLTGEERYLQPYEAAVAKLPGELDAIDQAASGHVVRSVQLASFRGAVDEKLAELAEVVELYRAGDNAKAMEIVLSDRGKAVMDRLRSIAEEMQRNADADLNQRFVTEARLDRSLRWASFTALAAVLALGIYGVATLNRRVREVSRAHDELSTANEALRQEISSREAAEAQLRQMQKMEAIGQLTGGIAHDFNNMLAVILSAMNLMQRKLARGETDVRKFVDAAVDAAGRAASLTARLLAFSRQQPLEPQVVDANRMVTGMSDLLRRTLGETVRIETVLAGGLWRTHADPSQLENAILNLAVNGRDAMPDGGCLTIETANCDLDDRYAATHEEVTAGQYVMVAVTDTGTGMSPEVLARAFDPFFTTKAAGKGTGLGLSQVFGFVKQSGGHVKIYSEPGSGTTVKIYLKRHFGEEQPAMASGVSSEPTRQPTETILVVEDDERVRAASVEALCELGYTVVDATDGPAALRILEERDDIALIFTDIVMPGMNGRKLAEEARALRPGLKVLFTTGFTRNAVVHNGVLDHGVNFLAKPFTLEQLAAKVRAVLDRAG